MTKLITIIITIIITSGAAYALRDPQIPDGSILKYEENISVNNSGFIKIQINGETIDHAVDTYTCKILSYEEDKQKYYNISLLSEIYNGKEIKPGEFFLILKNDLSPVLLQYDAISKSLEMPMKGKMQWDYKKKILHYYGKNLDGKNGEIKYDVDLQDGIVYQQALSAYPLGAIFATGLVSNGDNKNTFRMLAPYTTMFGMPIVKANVIITPEIEYITTSAGQFRCHKISVVPEAPRAFRFLLWALGMLDNFGEKFTQVYWVTDAAPYITIKYHINIGGSMIRDGILQRFEFASVSMAVLN